MARNLDTTGLKVGMVTRLVTALEEEKTSADLLAQRRAEEIANQPCKLFVGQVPNSTTDQQLRELFSPYGNIQEIQFMKDKMTQQPKGCAFVVMSTETEANLVVETLHEKMTLPGAKRSMIVNKHASKNDKGDTKVYVGMLSRQTTEDEVRELFSPYGQIKEIFMMKDKASGQSKGNCFVKFINKSDASRAISALNESFKDKDSPAMIQVRFAHSPEEKTNQGFNMFGMGMGGMGGMGLAGMGGMGGMQGMQGMQGMGAMAGLTADPNFGFGMNPYAPVQTGFGAKPVVSTTKTLQSKGPAGANLFVLGIPDTYGDADLGNLFSNFGNVISSKIQVDTTTGHSKGFGFCSFDNATSATAAITSMDGFMLGAKRLQVRVKKNDGGGASSTGYRPY